MNVQDAINKLSTYSEDRRKTAEAAYERRIHNQEIEAIMWELSEAVDLE